MHHGGKCTTSHSRRKEGKTEKKSSKYIVGSSGRVSLLIKRVYGGGKVRDELTAEYVCSVLG